MRHALTGTPPCADPSLVVCLPGRVGGGGAVHSPHAAVGRYRGQRRKRQRRILLMFSVTTENFWRSKDDVLEGLRPALRRHANNPMVPWPCIPGEKVRRKAGRSPSVHVRWGRPPSTLLPQTECQSSVRPCTRGREPTYRGTTWGGDSSSSVRKRSKGKSTQAPRKVRGRLARPVVGVWQECAKCGNGTRRVGPSRISRRRRL